MQKYIDMKYFDTLDVGAEFAKLNGSRVHTDYDMLGKSNIFFRGRRVEYLRGLWPSDGVHNEDAIICGYRQTSVLSGTKIEPIPRCERGELEAQLKKSDFRVVGFWELDNGIRVSNFNSNLLLQ